MKLEALPTNDDWTDYDWSEVFPGAGGDYSGTYRAGDLSGERIEDVTAERIALVLAWHADSPEGYASLDFWTVVMLTDGQFAVSEAWADTTGWGCQAGAWWKVGTYDQCVAELSEPNRKQLLAMRP